MIGKKLINFVKNIFIGEDKTNIAKSKVEHVKISKLKLTKDILVQDGIKKDPPDNRDKIKESPIKVGVSTSYTTEHTNNDQYSIQITDTSLRSYAPDSYLFNQKQLNACGGFSGSAAIYILMNRMQALSSGTSNKYKVPYFSPLWIYWYARDYDGFNSTASDCGTTLRSVMKALSNPGVVEEKVWKQYSHFVTTEPDENAKSSNKIKIHGYFRIKQDSTAPQLAKDVLAIEQLPIIAGINIYTEQLSKAYRNGIFEPVRNRDKAELIGGHAICVTGYKQINDKTYLEFLNSWGPDFGDNGYGYFPIEWLMDDFYCFDAWTFDKKYF